MSSSNEENFTTLTGKVAIVTGSSSGIGAAIARELSRRGAHVVVHYAWKSERQRAEDVVTSLREPSTSMLVEADLSTIDGPQKLADAAAERFGVIDILVNCAGISTLSPIETLSDNELLGLWDRVINVNGRGTLLLTRACLKYLAPKHSRIINIGSTTSRKPDADMTIYAGSKGMTECFTRCWARDLPRKYGCTVNLVAPGPTATENMLAMYPPALEMLKSNLHRIPVASRMGEPGEVAWTVAMLCEEQAGWLNGLYIPVAGGEVFT